VVFPRCICICFGCCSAHFESLGVVEYIANVANGCDVCDGVRRFESGCMLTISQGGWTEDVKYAI